MKRLLARLFARGDHAAAEQHDETAAKVATVERAQREAERRLRLVEARAGIYRDEARR